MGVILRAQQHHLCLGRCPSSAAASDAQCSCEREWTSDFRFVQVSDPQLGMFADNADWAYEEELCRIAVQRINQLHPRPRFVIACGDLTHAEPDKPAYQQQVNAFRTLMNDLDDTVPLVCVCGNHDVGNTPDLASLNAYRSNFGDDVFSFWAGGTCCIVLNSMLYSDGSKSPEAARSQDEWLTAQLAIAKKQGAKHILVFQHIPWFLKEVDEDNDYFNIDRTVRMEILNKLRTAGVRAVFSGHWHRNSGGHFGTMEMVVSGPIGVPLGEDASGIRVVDVTESNLVHQYQELVEFVPPAPELTPPQPGALGTGTAPK